MHLFRRINNEILHYYCRNNSSLTDDETVSSSSSSSSSSCDKEDDDDLLVYECHFGKKMPMYNHSVFTFDVYMYHSKCRMPKVYFQIGNQYPFQSPRMFIGAQEYSTCYDSYVQASSKFINSLKDKIDFTKAENTEIFKELLLMKCFCCCSKTFYPNWKPTYHLIDIYKEFYYVYQMKKKMIRLYLLSQIMEKNDFSHTLELHIGSYL